MPLNDDIALAEKLLNEYTALKCGQYLEGKDAEINKSKSTEIEFQLIGHKETAPLYWLKRGDLVNKILLDGAIRCADSAAMAVRILSQQPSFSSSLAVIKQGRPEHGGHWFVIAGIKEDLDQLKDDLDKQSQIVENFFGNFTLERWEAIKDGYPFLSTYPFAEKFPKLFVIDIWGECLMRMKGEPTGSAVRYPPSCFFTVSAQKLTLKKDGTPARPLNTNALKMVCRFDPPFGEVKTLSQSLEFSQALNTWTYKARDTFKKKTGRIYPEGVNHDFSWWFQYFWDEALVAGASDQQWNYLLTLMYGSPSATQDEQITQITAILAVPISDDAKKAILRQLLEMGFISMQQLVLPVPGDLFPHRIPLAGGSLLIGFRGEGRNFDTVTAHRGALRKVDIPGGLENTRQPWHPFNEPGTRNNMYLRKGAGDNCLYTVISIADTLPVAIGFPLIEDENIYALRDLRSKSLSAWDAGDIDRARACGVALVKARCRLEGIGEQSLYFLGTENYLYVTKVNQPIVNTQAEVKAYSVGEGECREQGIKGIPLSEFMLGVRLRRVHLGLERMKGIYAFIEECKYFDGLDWHTISTLQASDSVTLSDPARRFYTYHFSTGGSINHAAANNFRTTVLGGLFKLKMDQLTRFTIPKQPLSGETTGSTSISVGGASYRLLEVLSIEKWDVDTPTPGLSFAYSVGKSQAKAFSNLLPATPSGLNYALSNEPILLNGMKVIFDRPVSVYPVTLEPKAEAER